MKKIGIVLGLLIVSIAISACGLGAKPSAASIYENVAPVTVDDKDIETIKITNLDSAYTVDDYYSKAMVLVVHNASSEVGVWSLYETKMIITPELNVTFNVQNDNICSAFLIKNWASGDKAVYDIFGNEIVAKNIYNSLTVLGKSKVNTDLAGETTTQFYERVEYILQSDYASGERQKTIKTYLIDPVAKTRVEDPSLNDFYEYGETYDDDKYLKQSLTPCGLDGYYKKTISNVVNVYKNSGELVNSIILPSGVTNENFFDGQLFYQILYSVDTDVDDYTYATSSAKYKLITKSVDLLSGKETIHNVNYKMSSIAAFKDTDGIYNYARIKLQKIDNKVLETGKTYEYICNYKGELIQDITALNFDNLRSLDETHFYNTNTQIIYDKDLNIIAEIDASSVLFNLEAKVLIFQNNGYYGAINFDGNVVIPFIYDKIDNNFDGSSTYVEYNSGLSKFIKTDNSDPTLIPETHEELSGNLIIKRPNDVDISTGLYNCKIVNRRNEEVGNVSLESLVWPTVENFHTAYANYDLFRMDGDGTSVVYMVCVYTYDELVVV